MLQLDVFSHDIDFYMFQFHDILCMDSCFFHQQKSGFVAVWLNSLLGYPINVYKNSMILKFLLKYFSV
jgi:hypothetical protein